MASIANNAKQINLNISRIFDISVNYSQKIIKTKQYSLKASFANIIFAVYHPPVTSEANKFVIAGKMIISLSMNITMNQLGGASVIAKFHS